MRIGVLALQGDFAKHQEMLARIDVPSRQVRSSRDLAGLDGLVLPGGESTTMLKLLREEGLDQAIVAFSQAGRPVYGTCAGAILLAREVSGPEQVSLGLLDIGIERNAYGRQVDSHVGVASCESLGREPLEMVFIRAPVIRSVGPEVAVLARHRGDPVFVRQGSVMATTFHPELSTDSRVHHFFVNQLAPLTASSV
jgi:5'-phosphate synthase pdxT subunit